MPVKVYVIWSEVVQYGEKARNHGGHGGFQGFLRVLRGSWFFRRREMARGERSIMIPPLQMKGGHAIKTAGKTRTRRERVMEFIHDDFLLHSEMARRLYHDYAAEEPVLDYHSHLPSADIASDHRFRNLWEIWLQGDHYKWRLMRANGVPEKYCTGDVPSTRNFWPGPAPFQLRFAVLFMCGRTSN